MKNLLTILKKYWGYDRFLAYQKEAMGCVLEGRESVVVLPTGGGKSLCFQAPALVLDGMAVVVSPLISLMKDQVDALIANGIPAGYINSSMTSVERRAVDSRIRDGSLKLLYISPERLVMDSFIEYLKRVKLSFVAIDEAHCISAWGHDFRPEYRKLKTLKEEFPGIAIHAYTATATEPVREDIASELNIGTPEFIVGFFDRPNLIYSVKRVDKRLNQVIEVLERHPGESGIIYCIRRADVDTVCSQLIEKGYNALPYHAGMNTADRTRNQERFIRERTDIIVATIAFGMGIDKSNVRFIVHSGMPKSIEHYQQESGRAGRDGLEAECLLIFSDADLGTWSYILKDQSAEVKDITMKKLYRMYDYCVGLECRHKALVNYFGQEYDSTCENSCDICLENVEVSSDALQIAQKILSNVKRLNEYFGADHNAKVLTGSKDKRLLKLRHDQISTYGLLKDYSYRQVRIWIDQLLGQGCLVKVEEFGTLKIEEAGWQVLRGEIIPKLLEPPKPREAQKKIKRAVAQSWEDVDTKLFERLRSLRIILAEKRHVPAYIIFSDNALRDMARRKPETMDEFLMGYGVGEIKAQTFGEIFTKEIRDYLEEIR
ncbi:MAG: DNA helicase RecQ [Candidatus Electryonea clarkiae]|nr:DNA helicase RecQ [Candidatus Electryonea clarkiae]MDP8287427.1 DNA helicase RecQ [Candidatus Electryonea clarkiae]